MSNFVKTIDNSSLLENAIQLALQPYASMTYVASYVSAAINDLATSASVPTSIANALLNYSTTTLMNSAIATAIQPLVTTTSLALYSTTNLMNTAITNATRPLAPLTYVVSYVSSALLPYGKTIDINSSIATAILPLATSSSVSSDIATAIQPLATSSSVTASIASSSLISLTNIWTGANTFRGVCNAIQSADTILPVIFSATPSFSMTTGMVYNLSTTATVLTSLAFTNIPTTPQQTYVFSFVLLPTTNSSPWYLRPPTNFISITPQGGALLTVPIYGISSVVFPTSYTYIVQTITIVNTSTTTSPTFISFLSVSGY
jgi:hypothetical protein